MVDAITVATAQASTSQSGASGKKFDEDYTNFLTLLTTQLQHQDPTSPMDSSEFTSQLVQFTSVEQQIQTNQNLENLTSLMSATMNAGATSYLGQDAVISGGTGYLENSEMEWNYQMPTGVANAGLAILNEKGEQVMAVPLENTHGAHDYTWDGKDSEGNTVPEGYYQLRVLAFDQDGNDMSVPTQVKQRITAVEMSGFEPTFTAGGMQVSKSDIHRLMLPTN